MQSAATGGSYDFLPNRSTNLPTQIDVWGDLVMLELIETTENFV